MRKKPEILAPAGSMEALRAAVCAGADAVYLGGNRFGARAYADNFDETALINAIEYCHLYGVKVYLTINTLFRNEEIDELYDYLCPLYVAGLDAVIVQDLGVVNYVHKVFPDLPIHASTQMMITTKYSYSLLKDYGVTRIVPARELSLKELCEMKKEDGPELEVFVQGALCYCYSGACLMSSMIGGRSGNRGRCAQTCRLPYSVYDGDELLDANGQYPISPKDLCGLDSVMELIDAGVDSFKIEGRMKRPEYVGVCVEAYRAVVDACFEGRNLEKLITYHRERMTAVFNRGGFTEGYYKKHNGKDMMSMKHPGNAGDIVGQVAEVSKGRIKVLLSKDVYKGDIFLVGEDYSDTSLTCNTDVNAGAMLMLNVPKEKKLNRGQELKRMYNASLMRQLSGYYENERIIEIKGRVSIIEGENAILELETEVSGKSVSVTVEGETVEQAKSNPVSDLLVEEKLNQTGNTRYHFSSLEKEVSANAFYSIKLIKDLRREGFSKLEQQIISMRKRKKPDKPSCNMIKNPLQKGGNKRLSVAVSTMEQYELLQTYDFVDELYLEMQFFTVKDIIYILKNIKNNRPHYIMLPPVIRDAELKEFDLLYKEITSLELPLCGVILKNFDGFAYLHYIGYQGKIITDTGLYAMNDYAVDFIRAHFSEAVITIPLELNKKQLYGMLGNNENMQIVGYGYSRLMVSAQCINNNVRACDKADSLLSLKDRYNKSFFVKSVCKYCYSLIYNGIPTVLFDVIDKDIYNPDIRLHFTMENREEVYRVMNAYENNSSLDDEFTRGHFNRGVE